MCVAHGNSFVAQTSAAVKDIKILIDSLRCGVDDGNNENSFSSVKCLMVILLSLPDFTFYHKTICIQHSFELMTARLNFFMSLIPNKNGKTFRAF
jgi:hypothetical protein